MNDEDRISDYRQIIITAKKEIERLTKELERYKQGVEVEGRVTGACRNSRDWMINTITLPPAITGDCGDKVRVLVMKENGE